MLLTILQALTANFMLTHFLQLDVNFPDGLIIYLIPLYTPLVHLSF